MRPRMLILLVAALLAALVWIAWRRVELVPTVRALDPVADPRGGGATDALALAEASTRAARYPQASAEATTLDPVADRRERGSARSCVFHVKDARTHAPIESFGLEVLVQHDLHFVPDWKLPTLPLAVHPGGMLERLVPSASCQVVVEAAGYAALEEDIGDGTDVTLALCRESSIRGRLVFEGRPVASAKVEVERELIDQWDTIVDYADGECGFMKTDVSAFAGRRRAVESGPDGCFAVSGLARGTYSLRFSAPNSPDERPRGLKVPFEDALDLGDITLEREAVVHGRLLRAPGDMHRCYCVYFDQSVVAPVRIVDDACTFEFRKLRAGHHSIGFGTTPLGGGAETSSLIPRVKSFELAAGEVREMDLDATACKPCEVIVHVVRDGQPTSGINVEAWARLEDRGVIHRLALGTSGEDGIVRSELDGDARFELVACG